jgi:4-alpha-glucanotransferase
VPGPSDAIFDALHRALGPLPLIAEDLGEVTLAVKALRDRWALPGIRILQFAFGNDPSAPDFRPHNYPRNCVVYTGTHDNDTTVGWFYAEDRDTSTRDAAQVASEQAATLAYLGRSDSRDIHWAMVRACMASVANTAIFPLQDLLGLGTQARMNRPGALGGNWEWRANADAFRPELAAELARLTRIYDRHAAVGAAVCKG